MVFPYNLESQPYYARGEQTWSNNNNTLEENKFLSYK
jgi:hypothetical protein